MPITSKSSASDALSRSCAEIKSSTCPEKDAPKANTPHKSQDADT
jgi:hypothetical protein